MSGMIIYEAVAGNPYISYEAIAERLNIHKDTVRSRVKEIIGEIDAGRYPKKSIIEDEKIIRINEFVFMDYEANRKLLRNKATRKYVEPFDPTEWASMMGFRNRPVRIEE